MKRRMLHVDCPADTWVDKTVHRSIPSALRKVAKLLKEIGDSEGGYENTIILEWKRVEVRPKRKRKATAS